MQMQRQLPQGRVVRIRQIVDDGVQGVATHDVVVDFGGREERGVVCGGEEWVREVAEEVFEEGGYRGDVVVEDGRVAEVDLGGIFERVSLFLNGREGGLNACHCRTRLSFP